MSKEWRIDRRSFMQLAATGAVTAAAMLKGFEREAAAAVALPPRFLVVWNWGGWTPRTTFMRPPSLKQASWGHYSDAWKDPSHKYRQTAVNTAFDFSFTDARLQQAEMSKVLAPLWSVRSKMIAIEGMSMLAPAWLHHGDSHAENWLSSMTGGPARNNTQDGIFSDGAHPSVHMRFYEALRKNDASAKALNLWVRDGHPSGYPNSKEHWWLYGTGSDGQVQRIKSEAISNPSRAIDKYFAGLTPPAPGEETTRIAARGAMFTQLQSLYGSLMAKVKGSDRARLDQHRQLLSEIQAGLATPPIECAEPALTAAGSNDRHAKILADYDSHADIITAAFGCGLSRVACLAFDSINNAQAAYGLSSSTNVHEDYEHKCSIHDTLQYAAEGSHAEENACTQRNVVQTTRLARLISRLDQMDDVGGNGSVLDNTIVIYVCEAGDGAHGVAHPAYLVFGGGNLGLSTGRYVKYAQDTPSPYNPSWSAKFCGKPETRLYLTLLRQLGMSVDHLNASTLGARNGATIDMASSLTGLT